MLLSGGLFLAAPRRISVMTAADIVLPLQTRAPLAKVASADCEEMLVDGSTLDPIFIGVATLPGGTLGTIVFDVAIDIDIPGSEREDRGYCALSGTAQIEQQDGTVHEVPCGPAFLSFARPTLTGTAPILGRRPRASA
jgi:hypothetical protein